MMNQAEIVLLMTARDDATRVIQKVKGAAGEATSALAGMAKIAGGFVLAQGIIAAPAIIGGLRDKARDLELQMQKSNVVFGDQIGVVKKWADENAHSMGLTEREATNAAAGFADLLIPMGFAREEAAKMSTDVVGLSGALAEWSGGTVDAKGASDILAKAMLGERDGLKALGISISEADVQQMLMVKGQAELTGAALAQAKAVATQELIFSKSTDAQAAFAKGAGSAARRQAEFNATVKEWKETAALALAGGFLKVQEAAAAALPAVQKTIGFIADHKEILAGVAATILVMMVPSIWAWVTAQWALTTAQIAGAAAFVVANAPLIALAVGIGLVIAGVILLIKHWDTIWPKVKNTAIDTWEFIANFIDEKLSFIATIAQFYIDLVKNYVQTGFLVVKDIFAIVMALIHGDWGKAWEAIKQLGADLLNGIVTDITLKLQLLKDLFGGFPGRLLGMLMDWAGAGLQLGAAVGNAIIGAIKSTLGAAGDLASSLIDAVKGAWNAMIDWADEHLKISVGKGRLKLEFDPDLSFAKLAAGTRNFRGGLALVGEQGPEIAYLPRGSNVYSNSESQRMLGGNGTPATVHNTITVHVQGDATDRTIERMKQEMQDALVKATTMSGLGGGFTPVGAYNQ